MLEKPQRTWEGNERLHRRRSRVPVLVEGNLKALHRREARKEERKEGRKEGRKAERKRRKRREELRDVRAKETRRTSRQKSNFQNDSAIIVSAFFALSLGKAKRISLDLRQ
ncbi:hypothetical protein HZH66_010138 [Vespula vulgaris]|uniref:Uncharacterized protein n=1 Tax=Vespula vulgaris TaxID=7454 RepID=A0A834JIC6_VESVU|nr:hypothetical protein HZH66_010138 [Vespula vulgaris]